MDIYTQTTQYNALQATDDNRAQLETWGVNPDNYTGTPMWVVVPVGSALPEAIVDDATFQARYAKA